LRLPQVGEKKRCVEDTENCLIDQKSEIDLRWLLVEKCGEKRKILHVDKTENSKLTENRRCTCGGSKPIKMKTKDKC